MPQPLKPIQDIPGQLHIIEQLSPDYNSRHPTALAECPDCGWVRPVERGAIRKRQSTLCNRCQTARARHDFIADTENIIILEQYHSFGDWNVTSALVKCPSCNLVYERRRKVIKRCGHTICYRCARSGERNPNWRGGHILYPLDWRQVTAQVRERDFDTCQFPGCEETSASAGRLLAVHHIVPLRESHDNSGYNLITLCPSHHRWADCHLDESIPMFDAIIGVIYDGW